jgi:DNA-binding LytR/AlgR family response regulator
LNQNRDISCLIVDDEAIAREIIATYLSKIPNINTVDNCSNAIEAFNFLRNNKVDLVFLDINMPEVSGISFARSINKDIKIIFTTAYRDYAVEGFELQAVDYLLKPISFNRLLKAINNYFDIYSELNNTITQETSNIDFMFVRADRRMIKIDFNAIIYIESYSDYLKIHLSNGTIITRETISSIEVKLPNKKFIRIHRSYIIALANIIINKKSLPISRSYKKEVLNILEKF